MYDSFVISQKNVWNKSIFKFFHQRNTFIVEYLFCACVPGEKNRLSVIIFVRRLPLDAHLNRLESNSNDLIGDIFKYNIIKNLFRNNIAIGHF
jgi:hypothetical protein